MGVVLRRGRSGWEDRGVTLASKAANTAFEFVEKVVFAVAAEHNSVKFINKLYQVNSKSHYRISDIHAFSISCHHMDSLLE